MLKHPWSDDRLLRAAIEILINHFFLLPSSIHNPPFPPCPLSSPQTMHFPNPHLILPLLSILPSLFPPTIAAPSSPQLANPLSIPPSKLPAHPHLRTTTDPLPLRIPIPKDPHGRYITLIVHIAAHPLSEQQIGECLVALNQVVSGIMANPTIGPRAVIPSEVSPPSFPSLPLPLPPPPKNIPH